MCLRNDTTKSPRPNIYSISGSWRMAQASNTQIFFNLKKLIAFFRKAILDLQKKKKIK